MPAGKLRNQRGFTLIELLITLMIAAIIAMIAVPKFATFVARQQLASDVNEMISVLSFARSEAIKQRTDIDVMFSSPDTTTASRRPESCRSNEVADTSGEGDQESTRYRYSGWCYWVATSTDTDKVLRVGQLSSITTPEQAFSLTFQGLGDASLEGCPSTPCDITISSNPQKDAIAPITLSVNTTGSIRRKESFL